MDKVSTLPDKRVLRDMEKSFSISTRGMRRIMRDFHLEMERGLAGERSSLKMIPAYVDSPTGGERGEYLALDLGGTNFRILALELTGRGRSSVSRVRNFVLDRKYLTGEGDELFSFLARSIKAFLSAGAKARDVGFTFSFPVEQTGVASGTLLGWTKGFKAKGVIGKDVVSLLEEALAREGLGDVKVAALANDTVGTLVARGYSDRSCDVGVIVGTGTNACYVEKLSRIPKWRGPAAPSGGMIVNTEWGNFGKLNRTFYDRRLDAASANPGQQTLEKMVSGMYLGSLARLIIARAAKRDIKDFKTEHMSAIEGDRSKGLVTADAVLRRLGIARPAFAERSAIKKICHMVALRGARITAAAIAALITRMDPKLSTRHTVAIDGSVYEKHPGYSKNIRSALKELFGKKDSNIKIALTKDGSGRGAAIIAALALS